jgi:hypothetical protein
VRIDDGVAGLVFELTTALENLPLQPR